LRPSSRCDGLSFVVFLQQPCPGFRPSNGPILFDSQQGAARRCCVLNNVVRSHQTGADEVLAE
jgi:hypothetical protein